MFKKKLLYLSNIYKCQLLEMVVIQMDNFGMEIQQDFLAFYIRKMLA
jgi:hypothetical protein